MNKNIITHPPVNIYPTAIIGIGTNIGMFAEIGEYVQIGKNCKIGCSAFIPKGIIIGNNVFIGPHVVFCNDKYPETTDEWECLKTIVEDNVSIGANATILPGIYIKKNARIGAGAVVTKDIADSITVYGNPAIEHYQWTKINEK